MRAISAGETGVRGARLGLDRRFGQDKEYTLQVVRDPVRQVQRLPPLFGGCSFLVDIGAGNGDAAAELLQRHRRADDAAHAGAHQKVLIEDRIGAESGFGIAEDFAENGGDALLALLLAHIRRGRLVVLHGGGERRRRAGKLGEDIRGRARCRCGAARRRAVELFRVGREDQVFDIDRRFRHRHQLGAGGARRGFHRADDDGKRPARQGRTECYEIAALQVAKHFRLPAIHAEQVRGTRHVDIEEGAAHQEVGGFGGDVLGELGKALRGDDAGKPALSPTAHQVGHRAQRHFSRVVGDFAGGSRGEHLRFVDDDQHREPEVAIGIEQRIEEDRSCAHLLVDFEPLQRQHAGDPVLADAGGDADQLRLAALAIDDDMAELVRKRDEIPFGIDHHLLHPLRRLLQQPAQQMRLAGAGIALNQKAGRQQLLYVQPGGAATGSHAHIDADLHFVSFPRICPAVSIAESGRGFARR